MELIPVIDIMAGRAVHARRGHRQDYRPLQSPLSPGPDPVDVIRGLLTMANFNTFYLADLDALGEGLPQIPLLAHLVASCPDITFWMDLGPHWTDEALLRRIGRRHWPVIGSESLDESTVEKLAQLEGRYSLSLDFGHQHFLGPPALLQQAAGWPSKIILMNLGRVGTLAGPDFLQLERFIRRHPEHEFTVAGGVRDDRDLASLEAMGASAVLVATALHEGRITTASLRRYVAG